MPVDYSKVKQLITMGFLTSGAELKIPDTEDTIVIVFKSLSHAELNAISVRASSYQKIHYLDKLQVFTLLQSTLFVDGENILIQKDKYYPLLLDFYQKLYTSELKVLLNVIDNLLNEVSNLEETFTRFIYSQDSRYMWRYIGENNLNKCIITGIDGTETLPLNEFQKMWVSINKLEDTNEQFKRDFNNALFVASAFTKVDKVRAQLDAEEKEENERRKRIVDGVPFDEVNIHSNSTGIKSVDELKREMEASVRGEKDLHDIIIEDYENKIKEDIKRKIELKLKREQDAKNNPSGFLDMSSSANDTPTLESSTYSSIQVFNQEGIEHDLKMLGTSYDAVEKEIKEKLQIKTKSKKEQTAFLENNQPVDEKKIMEELLAKDPKLAEDMKKEAEVEKKRKSRLLSSLR